MTSTAAARISHDRQPDRTGRGDDANETPGRVHRARREQVPARAGSISWHLLADGYTVTWAPAPARCSLTLDRHGPRGEFRLEAARLARRRLGAEDGTERATRDDAGESSTGRRQKTD